MGEMRYTQKIFAGKPEEKEVETDERIMSDGPYSNKVGGYALITMTDNRNQCQPVANMVMDL